MGWLDLLPIAYCLLLYKKKALQKDCKIKLLISPPLKKKKKKKKSKEYKNTKIGRKGVGYGYN